MNWADTENKPPAHAASETWLLIGGAAVIFGWMAFHFGWLTAHLFSATRFIMGDQGSYLYAIGRWEAGEKLYRDFAWQYGPLALGWYRAAAAVGGNTPLTLVITSSLSFAVAWLLIARLTIRALGKFWGGALAVLGLLPALSPSGLLAINGPHGAIEMLLLTLCAWLLGTGENRGRPWQFGILAGLLQWVRFGPHASALVGVLLITVCQLWPRRKSTQEFFQALGAFGWRLGAAYLLTIIPLAVWYFHALPAAGAWEQLWPTFMVEHYAKTYPNRWPHISSATEFMRVWLPAVVGLGLAVAVWLSGMTRPKSLRQDSRFEPFAGLMFLPLNYALGCAVLFHNDYTITGNLWMAWPGLALVGWLTKRELKTVVGLAIAPGIFAGLVNLQTLEKTELAWHAQALALPNGQQLWFRPEEAKRFQALEVALGPQVRSRALAIFIAGGGIHHFFGTHRVGRHWWFLPGFVRPWEAETAWSNLLQHDLVLVADLGQVVNPGSARPGVVALWIPLPSPMAEQLPAHLGNLVHLEGVGDLLQLRP